MVVTAGRAVLRSAREAGHVARLEAFGVRMLGDTCWCMLDEPVIPPTARSLITNSAKYAHYAPGLVGRHVRFAGLAGCAHAARTGRAPQKPPSWLLAGVASSG